MSDPTTASGLTSARIAECPDCYGRFLCQYHEGWSDAVDVLTPVVAQAQRDTDATAAFDGMLAHAFGSDIAHMAKRCVEAAPLITEEAL